MRQGKVRYLGSSAFPGSQSVEAQWVAHDRCLERFVCEQAPYSMLVSFDMSLPVNQRKLGATEALAHLAEDNGTTLIEMAIAFALNHPAVASVLIGPRTLDHLQTQTQLPAADVILDPAARRR
ncbi:aldo/keto reductase [Streptomyces sp. NPDC057002]|uniref:aldo/keto reductase n=1 Tax=Streptomyces sp. NPDC057002 TaxID=3345992 RepID=UPI00363205D4